jgi:hypothetical protein
MQNFDLPKPFEFGIARTRYRRLRALLVMQTIALITPHFGDLFLNGK